MNFEDFYKQLSKIEDNVQKGTKFELAIKDYLLKIDTYSFKEIHEWRHWEYRENKHDKGIDLIGETETGELIAIQCKCYHKDHKLSLSGTNLDNFFSLLNAQFKDKTFDRGIIISTCQQTSKELEDTLIRQKKNVSFLGYYDLAQSEAIGWGETITIKSEKKLYPHQKEAIENVKKGFEKDNKGKLIMACGTGKTFTSLRLLEELQVKRVLFLVPSLNLISQVSNEYSIHKKNPQSHLIVCSDSSIKVSDDSISDSNLSGTNDKDKILHFLKNKTQKIQIVFSTYQSLNLIREIYQENTGLNKFELVLCDEAHNIVGKKEEGLFNIVISDSFKPYYEKILFMTATPRLFQQIDKNKAKLKGLEIVGMDDENIYGKESFNYRFKQAIEDDNLCDYEILILKIKGSNQIVQNSKTYYELYDHLEDSNILEKIEKTFKKYKIKKIISFSNTIKNSKKVQEKFEEYSGNILSRHVDGTDTGSERKHIVQGWFKEKSEEVKILTNARCLSEGVDVPSVNAVMFVNPKKSTIDIIQSIGRAIRKSKGKKKGYIILPIIIPENENEIETIADSQYENILSVLLALRSYNDKEDIRVLLEQNIRLVDYDENKEPKEQNIEEIKKELNSQLFLFENKLYSKILHLESSIRKSYLDSWFRQVPHLRDELRIGLDNIYCENKQDDFIGGAISLLYSLQKTINPHLEMSDVFELLIQHILTGHILDVIFEGFYKENPVAKSFNDLESIFFKSNKDIEKEILKVRDFMQSIVMKGDDFKDKYHFLIRLYEGFYKVYDEKTAKKNGIVYTPQEVVDFIIKGADDLLQKHFDKQLVDKEVDIIDIATGTGSFIFRCLDYLFEAYGEGNRGKEKIKQKYNTVIHCNEISLLAYYVASLCIEHKYYEKTGEKKTFAGIVYQDTLDCVDFEGGDTSDKRNFEKHSERYLKENHERRDKQNAKKMTVIIGNPPYRANQGNENENNKNRKYDFIDERIKNTYVLEGIATNKNQLYDSYVRFIRWSSERIRGEGIIGFIVNNSFIDGKTFDGFRKIVRNEFSEIYILDLKGNLRKGEKHNVFDIMTGVCIVFFVKWNNNETANIHYKGIDALIGEKQIDSKEERLSFLTKKNITDITFDSIKPNQKEYWLDTEETDFDSLISLASKDKKKEEVVFKIHSNGVKSNRDSWVYDLDKDTLENKIKYFIDIYNKDLKKWQDSDQTQNTSDFVNRNIKHTEETENHIKKNHTLGYDFNCLSDSLYRPFSKRFTYYSNIITHRKYQISKIFGENINKENICIGFTAPPIRTDKSEYLITNSLGTLSTINTKDTTQYIPLYYYQQEKKENKSQAIFNGINTKNTSEKQDNITDWGLEQYQNHYNNKAITKEEIFYYIYAVFHKEQYLTKYKNDLKRELPRVPFYKEFKKLSLLGKELSKYHIDFEQCEKHTKVKINEDQNLNNEIIPILKIEKDSDKKPTGKIILDNLTTIENIPIEVFDYQIGSRSPIEWLLSQHKIKRPNQSDKTNYAKVFEDFNTEANELKRYREISRDYLMDLIPRLATVSLETLRIREEIKGI